MSPAAMATGSLDADVAVGTGVLVGVLVGGTGVGGGVFVGAGVLVGSAVGVGVGTRTAVGVGVMVLAGRGVGIGVAVGGGMAVGVVCLVVAMAVEVGVRVAVGRSVALAVAVGVGCLVTCCCSRQAGPPTENVAAAVLRPCGRTRRCEPAGALCSLLLNVTVIVAGRSAPRLRASVMTPVFRSTCICTDRALLVARATWRALQQPTRSTRAACALGEAPNPARDHTNVVDSDGGRGDVKVGTARQAGPP